MLYIHRYLAQSFCPKTLNLDLKNKAEFLAEVDPRHVHKDWFLNAFATEYLFVA
jgi:hypothetical protein